MTMNIISGGLHFARKVQRPKCVICTLPFVGTSAQKACDEHRKVLRERLRVKWNKRKAAADRAKRAQQRAA